MTKLYLKKDRVIQGNFKIKKLNLLLVFQVNCPGCFMYAIPIATQLFERYKSEELNILGLSTAFEDFDYNTIENTRLLLQEKQLVGETKKEFKKQMLDKYPIEIPFPVAFDLLGNVREVFDKQEVISLVKSIIKYRKFPDNIKEEDIFNIIHAHLSSQDTLPYTFTLNQLAGTPSWILFDSKYTIIKSWFGYIENIDMETVVDNFIKTNNS